MPDLAFYQAEDEQGEADHGDQGGDAPVVFQEQRGDGEGALERGVAAFDRFLSFALFSLTDLCRLTPDDAVASLVRTATTITASATRDEGTSPPQPGKRRSPRR